MSWSWRKLLALAVGYYMLTLSYKVSYMTTSARRAVHPMSVWAWAMGHERHWRLPATEEDSMP